MKAEHTKERILSQALTLFAQKGYEAVSVEEIAAAVGIKAPSLYKHYKGKRDIFDRIVAHMEAQDAQEASEHQVPEGTLAEDTAAYAATPFSHILTYSQSMFHYWTHDPFAAPFRKLLTLEQYRDAEMAQLYQQYLCAGPLGYLSDLFASLGYDQPQERALTFYAPMFFLYSVYDGQGDTPLLQQLLNAHWAKMWAEMGGEG